MIYRLLGGLALLAASCFGTPIYVWVTDAAGDLGEVNLATGKVTVVGNAGVALTGLAFSPSGVLYGITGTSLYTINTSTGAATLTGSLGDGISTANALAFSSSGTLYTADDENLYTVNPSTGLATDVGPMGFGSGGDLAFVGGTLYHTTVSGQLVTVNPSIGATSVVGNLGVANIWGLASPENVNLYGLASPDNINLYLVAGENLYSINLTSGAATFDVTWAGTTHGLGVAYGATAVMGAADPVSNPVFYVSSVPTPEPATLTLFGVGCLLLALRFRLRSSSAATPIRETLPSKRQQPPDPNE